MSQKIVINKCYGGFSVSGKALLELRKRGNVHALNETFYGEKYKNSTEIKDLSFDAYLRDIPRDDKDLVALVEEWGDDVSGECAELKVVEIPDGIKWEIEEYDGMEKVSEVRRIWY